MALEKKKSEIKRNSGTALLLTAAQLPTRTRRPNAQPAAHSDFHVLASRLAWQRVEARVSASSLSV
jgi:hypothetical protein